MRTLSIRLTPKASSDRIGEKRKLPEDSEQLMLYVTAVPESGKANDSMIRLLSKHLEIAASRITVIRGATSRNKIIQMS